LQDEGDYGYLPGQHARLILDGAARRNFSIANAPGAAGPARLEFHIRRMPGGAFTDGILPGLQPGDMLTLDGAQGSCTWPAAMPAGIDHLVLLATGTGYAGVAPILMTALQSRALKTVTLYWGGRTPDDCYAGQMLDALQGKGDGFQWHAVLSQADRADGQPRHVQDAAIAADHDWSRSLRLRQSGNGAGGPRPAAGGRPARRPLPVRGLPPRGGRHGRRRAAARGASLGADRKSVV